MSEDVVATFYAEASAAMDQLAQHVTRLADQFRRHAIPEAQAGLAATTGELRQFALMVDVLRGPLAIAPERLVQNGQSIDDQMGAFAAHLAGLNLLPGTWDGERVVLPDGTAITALAGDPAPHPGGPAVALFRPASVAIYRDVPEGSPRNAIAARIQEIEPLGDRIRVRCGASAPTSRSRPPPSSGSRRATRSASA